MKFDLKMMNNDSDSIVTERISSSPSSASSLLDEEKQDDSETTISFVSKPEVILIEQRQDLTSDESAAYWYTKEDFKLFQEETRDVIEQAAQAFVMQQRQALSKSLAENHPMRQEIQSEAAAAAIANADNLTLRGLESRLAGHDQIQRRSWKAVSTSAVIDEQSRQYFSGTKDVDALRQVYRDASQHARRLARQVGYSDAKEAGVVNIKGTSATPSPPKQETESSSGFRKGFTTMLSPKGVVAASPLSFFRKRMNGGAKGNSSPLKTTLSGRAA